MIAENVKPILAEKIRYHADPVFKARLQPAPPVPRLPLDLHLARLQQRWRFADDELPEGSTLTADQLLQDLGADLAFDGPESDFNMEAVLTEFFSRTLTEDGGAAGEDNTASDDGPATRCEIDEDTGEITALPGTDRTERNRDEDFTA